MPQNGSFLLSVKMVKSNGVISMVEFHNFAEMFAKSIEITEPWRIEKASFDESAKQVHVYVSAKKTAKYACPICGELCERYDDEEEERVWQHGDVVYFPCFIHCKRPRVKCKKDGFRVVDAPWARRGSRFTLLFESYAMLLLEAMTVNEARKLLRISHTALTHIMTYWVNRGIEKQ
ncbi:MAG: helix-turn-helix domain-containing protein, partial [Clostridia bacterium]